MYKPVHSRRLRAGFFTAGLMLSGLVAAAQAPAKQWDRTLGGSAAEYCSDILPTNDGGYILAGSSSSGISGDKTQPNLGGSDYWLVKLDANGQKQWDKVFGGTGNDNLSVMLSTADGGYLLGGTSSSGISGDKTQTSQGGQDYWIIKLDANFQRQWDKTFGGPGTEGLTTVQATSDGGYILGGISDSNIGGDKTQSNVGGYDYWVVKISAAGQKQWDRTIGGNDEDILRAIAPTNNGGYLLAGDTWSEVSGDKTQPMKGGRDYWVVKLNAAGVPQWDRAFGGIVSWLIPRSYLQAVLPTPDGGFLLGGNTSASASGDMTQTSQGSDDYWLVKCDAAGTKQWDKAFGGASSDVLHTLQLTADGGYLLAGSSHSGIGGDKTQPNRSTPIIQQDYWLVKTDANGVKQWDLTLGADRRDSPFAVRQTTDGGFVVAGASNSGASGDKTEPNRGGDDDMWIVKLSAAGPTAVAGPHIGQPLTAYPNPAHQRLTLPLPADAPRTGLRLALLDATGRVVLQKPLAAPAGSEVPVDLGQQPAGLYLLRLEGPGGYLATQRVQVQ